VPLACLLCIGEGKGFDRVKKDIDSARRTAPEALLAKAKWLWPELGFHHLHNGYARFRRVVTLDAVPAKCIAYVTADQSYRLAVNGKTVSRGPARGYQSSWAYDEVDLAPFLRKGRNVIAIRAYNPGHSSFAYRSEGWAGMLFAARIGGRTVVSDGSWKCRREEGTRRDTWPYSLQLSGHQECVDLRKDDPDWQNLSFDDSKWMPSEQLRLWNAPPYGRLEPRGIPQMREFTLKPKLIAAGEGSSAPSWQSARDLAALRASEGLRHQPCDRRGANFTTAPTGRGKFRSYLLDFGKVVVGSPRITVHGARGGETIDLLHTEIIRPDEFEPRVDIDDYCRVRLANRMICRKGAQSHAFFHHLGSRYLVLTVRESRAPLRISVSLEACGYPFEERGSFDCSDPALNRIWNACAHTQRICALDAYVDTPWREQAQWWGDARIQAWNTFHLSDDVRLLRRGIRILAGQTTPDGLTYGHAPTIAHNCVLPDFSLIWILSLWDDYWQTGETVMLERHHERVSTILGYFRQHTDPSTGLVRYDPRYWLFLDWTDIQKDGQPALLSLWLLFTLKKLAKLVSVSSLADDFEGVADWARRLQADVGKRLLGRDGLVCDGLSNQRRPSQMKSLQAQTLAWMCELPGWNKAKALGHIFLPWLREDKLSHASPSSYWCAYPLDLLAREGHEGEVVDFIKRHWSEFAEFGSCFENYDAHPEGGTLISHSHAWSAHPLYLLMQIIGGVRQSAPGWREVTFRPSKLVKNFSVVLPTPRGLIRVSRAGCAKGAEVSLLLPAGTRLRRS
jgi:alpha-L-rhamnosidase